VPPGPKGWPLIGPLLDLRRDVLGTMHKALLRFGDVVRFAGGPPGRFRVEIYALYHPDAVQKVRQSDDDMYSKDDPTSVEMRALLGNGLLTSTGDVWQRQRRIADPLFSPEGVARWFPVMAEEGNRLVARWRSAAERGDVVDLHHDASQVARRVIARVVFGPDAEAMLPVFSERIPYLSERAFNRGLLPLRVPASWPTPGNRKAARAKDVVRRAFDDVIARRRREPEDDLVSLLLAAPDPEGGPGFEDQEVGDHVMVILLAGAEQVATSITFALHLLGHHPHAQRRAHDELDAVLGGRPLTLADVDALTDTTAAVKEAMRLYPPAYGLARRSEQEQRHGGYRVPARRQVAVAPWVTHRHPGFWDQPELFDPGRFTPDAEAGRHPFAYLAFGGGPHSCVGANLATLETIVVVATVLQAYRVVTEPWKVPLSTALPLRPKAAMPAGVVAR
jgi:cytochrome P450